MGVFETSDGLVNLAASTGKMFRAFSEAVGHPELAEDETVRGAVKDGLMAYNRANPNSAKRIARILLEKDQPKPDAGEITEKGYINQGRVQALREGDVKRLYAKPYDADIIEIK